MAWIVEFDDRALKELKKLDRPIQKRILDFLRVKISTDENPKRFGKPLIAEKKGLWCYRVDDYRIICRIEDQKLVVLVLALGHRKQVYK